MNILLVIIIAASIIILLIAKNTRLVRGEPGGITDYKRRGLLFTPAERAFLEVLEQALDSRYRVFGKARLGDLIKPATGLDAGRRTTSQKRIDRIQVDFVICTANELALVGVLALDDQSHGHEDRVGRGGFADLALAMAGVPLLSFPVKDEYAVQVVRARLAEMMRADKRSAVVSAAQEASVLAYPALDAIMESTPVQPDSFAPGCPQCSSVMVKRQTVRGQNAGRYFWACSSFPLCKQVVKIGEG
jgi:hypothetical protein